jgi:hypothetical protein
MIMAAPTTRFTDIASVVMRAGRVGANVLVERVRPAIPRTADEVPGSVDRITPAWLTSVLCAAVPGGKVLDFAKTGGDSGSSSREGLRLNLNDVAAAAGVPTHLFTKSAPTFVQRMFLGLTGAAAGEVGFYTRLRAGLDIEAPLCYHAGLDSGSWRTITVMEDVAASKGAKFISTETHIEKSMMEDLLSNIARWHAHYWNSPKLAAERAWLRTPIQFLDDVNRFVSVGKRALVAMERYAHLLPEGMTAAQGDELWEATQRSFQINATLPQTLLHGDAHIGQSYITAKGRMGYGDWQLIQRGGWAADFAYSVTSALTIEDRRSWERDLLDHYRDQLRAAGGPALDAEDAWTSYRQHTLYPFFAWAFTRAGAGAVQPNMQPDYVCNDIMSRTAHAVSDLDATGAVRAAG